MCQTPEVEAPESLVVQVLTWALGEVVQDEEFWQRLREEAHRDV